MNANHKKTVELKLAEAFALHPVELFTPMLSLTNVNDVTISECHQDHCVIVGWNDTQAIVSQRVHVDASFYRSESHG